MKRKTWHYLIYLYKRGSQFKFLRGYIETTRLLLPSYLPLPFFLLFFVCDTMHVCSKSIVKKKFPQ
ncbi:hypothetical protein BCR43DRAFT_495984 [Syncephalastrum racemosum]|uniref:Uncharacterized protein n=1 Tax=Syncephalastrum racemosum TaxID=13706 RepID=A0A1X2H6Y6_SYNRA|nr:hypothetical protein BCR43DRAFT_495984 [Syncephalastrum racemosum]